MLASCKQNLPKVSNDRLPQDFSAALHGNQNAIRRFVEKFSPIIQGRIGRVLWRQNSGMGPDLIRQETEDLGQETLARLFENEAAVLKSWDPQKGLSLTNFVGLVAQRTATAWLRSGRKNAWRETPMEASDIERIADRVMDHSDLVRADTDRPDRQLATSETLQQVVMKLREALPQKGFEVFYFVYLKEYSSKEVCRKLNLKPDTVYSWRTRLMKRSRSIMSEIARISDFEVQGSLQPSVPCFS